MTTANSGVLSMHKVFVGGRLPMPVLPFCKPAYHRVPPLSITDPRRARICSLILGTITGATVSRSWTRRREGSCTRTTSHGTRRRNRSFPRPRQSDRECLIYYSVPKRRITCISSRHLQLLPHLPPLQLPPHRCLHQPSPHQHPRRYQPPSINSRSHCLRTGARGGRVYAWMHARRDARNEGLTT